MLKQDTIEKIFSTTQGKGLRCDELYLEKITQQSIYFQGKQYKSLISQVSGASLTCNSAEGITQYSISDLAPESLLETLGCSEATLPEERSTAKGTQKAQLKLEKLLSLTRRMESLSSQFCLEYIQSRRNFALVGKDGTLTESEDESVKFLLHIQKDKSAFRMEEIQSSIDSFWENSFTEPEWLGLFKERLETPSLWPLPMGEVPVLLSHKSLSKILFHLLKSFEADNLVSQQSFLSYLEESVPLSFSLLETPSNRGMDQEGETTKSLSLFANGEFREFATNKRLATTLSLPKSGHGRRMSYKHAPQISLFSSKLVPNENLWMNFSKLQRAIFVEAIDIIEYDPKTTKSKILITHSKLVHHGDFGEKLVEWEWDISLLELLKHLKQFSKEATLHGFGNKKGSAILPTEITCADALIEGLPLPGTVPQEYYWE